MSLIIGHRISVDIDLFTDTEFEAEKLTLVLTANYRVDNLEIEKNTINCFIEDIKVDCIAHCYPWLKPAKEIEGIRLASIEDIAAMKFNTIVQDGSLVKDYMDIYVMLKKSHYLNCLNVMRTNTPKSVGKLRKRHYFIMMRSNKRNTLN